jgi:L-amino acid N-acyltransferase YncA
MRIRLRSAVPADAPDLAVIYNEGIAEREATFETRPRAADEVADWIAEGGRSWSPRTGTARSPASRA